MFRIASSLIVVVALLRTIGTSLLINLPNEHLNDLIVNRGQFASESTIDASTNDAVCAAKTYHSLRTFHWSPGGLHATLASKPRGKLSTTDIAEFELHPSGHFV